MELNWYIMVLDDNAEKIGIHLEDPVKIDLNDPKLRLSDSIYYGNDAAMFANNFKGNYLRTSNRKTITFFNATLLTDDDENIIENVLMSGNNVEIVYVDGDTIQLNEMSA